MAKDLNRCVGSICTLTDIGENVTALREYAKKYGDPRVSDWLLVADPMTTVYLIVLYLVFVKVVGPAWMKNREPYDVKSWMLVYNVVLVAASAWMFWQFASLGYFRDYSWRCEPVDYTSNPDAVRMAVAGYVYFLSKFVEFLDTIFFVLRKKYNQITLLHVYHHMTVPLLSWNTIKYGSGGYATFYMMLNVFVHIWMYSYYGLSGLGPEVQKYLWWKKYLTRMQIVQFVMITGHIFQSILFPIESCHISYRLVIPVFVVCLQYLYLFSRFYMSSYAKKAVTD